MLKNFSLMQTAFYYLHLFKLVSVKSLFFFNFDIFIFLNKLHSMLQYYVLYDDIVQIYKPNVRGMFYTTRYLKI